MKVSEFIPKKFQASTQNCQNWEFPIKNVLPTILNVNGWGIIIRRVESDNSWRETPNLPDQL